MAGRNKVKCINCGREISGIKAAKADGWIVDDEGRIFCCCVCISEYTRREKAEKRKKK